MVDINIRYFKRPEVTGGTVIDGFPNVGLIGSIIANFLIGELKMDQVGAIDSPQFPPVSMIYDNKPKFPARMYASEERRMVVVLSEFTPSPEMARPIAKAMLTWANEQHCERIITPAGLPVLDESKSRKKHEHRVYAVGSTTRARTPLKEKQIPEIGSGMVTGVPGILLNEGRWAKFPVVSFLVEVQKAAGLEADPVLEVLKYMKQLIPDCSVDLDDAKPKVEKIIERIDVLRHQAMPAQEQHSDQLMYTFDL